LRRGVQKLYPVGKTVAKTEFLQDIEEVPPLYLVKRLLSIKGHNSLRNIGGRRGVYYVK